jgi:hypothetical protein
MTGTTLASVKFLVTQKATVHKDIALNEGRVISLALFGIYIQSMRKIFRI